MLFPPHQLGVRRNEPEKGASLPYKSRNGRVIFFKKMLVLAVMVYAQKHSTDAAESQDNQINLTPFF